MKGMLRGGDMSDTLLTPEIARAQKKLEEAIGHAVGVLGKENKDVLPKGCTWQGWVEIGPDGRPVVKCGIKCG
jgi:hypothetical protein